MICIKKGDSVTIKLRHGVRCITVTKGTKDMDNGKFYYQYGWEKCSANVQDIINVYRPSEGWVIKND